jgi:hypothetical protein
MIITRIAALFERARRTGGFVILLLTAMTPVAAAAGPGGETSGPPASAGVEELRPVTADDLTQAAAWEYRAVTGRREGSWTSSLKDAVTALGPQRRSIVWPRGWTTFIAWENDGAAAGPSDNPASFTEVPKSITLNGGAACRAIMPVDAGGTLDFAAGHGDPRDGRWAYAFAQVELTEDQELEVRASASGPMTWWVGGKQVFQSTPPRAATPNEPPAGVGKHSFRLSLPKGKHILAVRVVSGSREWTLTSEAAPASEAAAAPPSSVQARCAFEAPVTAAYVSLTFVGPDADRVRLNGQPLPLPLPRMRYERVVGVPPAMLKAGRNELTRSLSADEAQRALTPRARTPTVPAAAWHGGWLFGLKAGGVEIQSGPVLTRATETSLTVACRTNASVPVVLKIDGRELRSPAGIYHRIVADGLKAAAAYPYTLSPAHPGASTTAAKGGTARTLPASGPFTIGLLGDGRTSPATWGCIARAVRAANPALVVYGGDLVLDGRIDSVWDRELFAPAADLLANVPLYGVIGNHERQSPVFDRFFTDSLGGRSWSQEVAGVLLVGVDGFQDWSASAPSAAWLDRTLADTKARFIFVITHYPAYSSSTHGRIGEDGRPGETSARTALDRIYPILQKHRVAAMIGGHDHCYERSEPPGGVTAITTAGAGAGLYGKRDDPKQNPYSQVFAKKHHYCLLRVEGDQCTLTAIDLEGQTIDTKTWKARGATK